MLIPKNKISEASILQRLQVLIRKLEDSILVGLLVLMIAMAVTQILLRNLLQSGIVWGDVMIRILVLWIGLVGSMVASREDNHIRIDVLIRILPPDAKAVATAVVQLFTAFICAVVAFYSYRFVYMEYETGDIAFALVPTWLCEAIIPLAFSVMALRYVILSFIHFKTWAKQAS